MTLILIRKIHYCVLIFVRKFKILILESEFLNACRCRKSKIYIHVQQLIIKIFFKFLSLNPSGLIGYENSDYI